KHRPRSGVALENSQWLGRTLKLGKTSGVGEFRIDCTVNAAAGTWCMNWISLKKIKIVTTDRPASVGWGKVHHFVAHSIIVDRGLQEPGDAQSRGGSVSPIRSQRG